MANHIHISAVPIGSFSTLLDFINRRTVATNVMNLVATPPF